MFYSIEEMDAEGANSTNMHATLSEGVEATDHTKQTVTLESGGIEACCSFFKLFLLVGQILLFIITLPVACIPFYFCRKKTFQLVSPESHTISYMVRK